MYYNLNTAEKEKTEYKSEKNDCTVRALAIAYNLLYVEAYKILNESGRLPDKRYNTCKYSDIINNLGCIENISLKPEKTIKRVVSEYNVGTYIIRYRGHVFALIDGIINDNRVLRENKRVTNIWKIK